MPRHAERVCVTGERLHGIESPEQVRELSGRHCETDCGTGEST